MAIKAIDLRRGMAVNFKDGLWICVENQKVAKGNWRSYQVIQLKNIKTGQLIEDRFRTDENFEEAFLERKPMEYLYSDSSGHVVMDADSYEQVTIPVELIGDMKVYLTPNLPLLVGSVDGKPLTVELPNTVELKVIDTPPQVKSATATNVMKEALCEGGAKVKVPAFIEIGTVLKVDTRTGEYLSRA
ncbi:MAG: elongation factor P [Planctomycetes bacterium]|nr:elongation factor P [Planctomycetota bacterium]